jgi:hypothetical protein
MDRVFWDIIASIALAFICSCGATKSYTYEVDRQQRTGIKAGEEVVIVLSTFFSKEKPIESEGEEKSLVNCVRTGMSDVNPNLKIASAKDLRHMLSPGKGFFDSPRSLEDLLPVLSNPDAQSRVLQVGVRYLVILSAITHESEGVWAKKREKLFDDPSSRSGAGVGDISRRWTRTSKMTADVLDVKYLRKSGTVTTLSEGEGAWGGMLGGVAFVGSPCCLGAFPYCTFPRTETEACSRLGNAVMKFLIDGRDVVPTMESEPPIDSKGEGPDIQTAPQPASEEDALKGPQEPGGCDRTSRN